MFHVLTSGVAVALIAAAPVSASRTVLTQAGRTRPAWFVCDPAEGDAVAVFGNRGADGLARATVFPRSSPRTPRTATYRVGEGDPGAGQVYYALERGGREAGTIHAVNPGVFDARTPVKLPPISSLDIEGVRTRCRLNPGAVFLGFTARRSVEVVSTSAGLAYRTFDFSRPPRRNPVHRRAGRARDEARRRDRIPLRQQGLHLRREGPGDRRGDVERAARGPLGADRTAHRLQRGSLASYTIMFVASF